MNKLNRTKTIEAAMESQGLANRAIGLCNSALLLLTFGGQDEAYSRECEAAVVTILRVAHEIAKEAEMSAKEGGIELPPDIKTSLKGALAALDEAQALAPRTRVQVLEAVKVTGLRYVRWKNEPKGIADPLPADAYEITTTDADRAAGDVRLTLVLGSGEPSSKHSYVAPRESITALVIAGKIRPAETRA